MLWRNTNGRYGVVHKFFHWIIAALILVNLALGLIAEDSVMGPGKFRLFFWHKSIGMTVLALASLRLVWKLVNPHPAKSPDHAGWERRLAALVHVLLYVAMITLPLTGWLGSAAKGIAVSVFGWFVLPNVIAPNKALGHYLYVYHTWAAWALIGLLALHVLGALKHHVVDRDDTLRRMMPFGRVRDVAPLALAALLLVSAAPALAAPQAWGINPAQSHLTFTATQNEAPFTGTFGKFDGTIVFDPGDLAHSSVKITIPLSSLTTGSDERDPYLADPAWFDMAKFPVATFTATNFSHVGPSQYVAHGTLQLHGISKAVDLPFTLIATPGGATVTATGNVTLHRLDFAIGSGEWADPKTVGSDVKVNIVVVAYRR